MKLSEAMMLGSGKCKMIPKELDTCALGVALWAIGMPTKEHGISLYSNVRKAWPWLNLLANGSVWDFMETVYERFDGEVCSGKLSYEQFVDWVRSIEPDCGECNQFVCICQKEAPTSPSSERQLSLCNSISSSSLQR